ncbi:hypothetical protein [Frigoriglobus tundricola]|uniref:HEAT repeat domain-containing protein n=1 Tax=Frigoriglobus tundricola TaxID=2774151 RepID=A0A6M5YF83_9BACT|nr:hypothetical protein [Frigoriglobus tundricola]QJW92638.1 hypothetical protein FTUN_0135 [Frigoriglobus tundricola]
MLICRTVLILPLLALTSVEGMAHTADKEKATALAKELKSKDSAVRLKAAERLMAMGPDAADVAREICEAILDPNAKVSLAAYNALEKVRPDLHKPMAKLILDKDNKVRAAGAKELGDLSDEAKPAALFLVKFLAFTAVQDAQTGGPRLSKRSFQSAAYESLQRIGLEDDEVIKQLKILAGSTTKSVAHRYASMELLIAWAEDRADRRKELIPLIKSGLDTPGLATAHCELAGNYGELSKELLPQLRKHKLSSETALRDAATKAVETIEAAQKK